MRDLAQGRPFSSGCNPTNGKYRPSESQIAKLGRQTTEDMVQSGVVRSEWSPNKHPYKERINTIGNYEIPFKA